MVAMSKMQAYDFFSGFTLQELGKLAEISQDLEVAEGYLFFQEGDQLDHVYLIEDGCVDICLEVPTENILSPQRTFEGGESLQFVSVSKLEKGDVFGWTSLVPPYFTNAGAFASSDCKILAIDSRRLETLFPEDWHFAYKMTVKTSQLIRERLRDLRIDALKQASG